MTEGRSVDLPIRTRAFWLGSRLTVFREETSFRWWCQTVLPVFNGGPPVHQVVLMTLFFIDGGLLRDMLQCWGPKGVQAPCSPGRGVA